MSPSTSQVREWASRSGASLHDRHVVAILEALERTGTRLGAWRLHVATQRGWAGRRCRAEAERGAVFIGESYSPKIRGGSGERRVLFLIPRKESTP